LHVHLFDIIFIEFSIQNKKHLEISVFLFCGLLVLSSEGG